MNKLILFALLSIVACEFTDREIYMEFQYFVKKYHKKYTSVQEYMARYRVFAKNFKRIERSNNSWEGVTQFFDMTPDEFRRTYLNLNITVLNTIRYERAEVKAVNAPESFDWRTEGAVNKVKDQGSCGSCWAFATCGNLEGLYYLKYKESMTFSEQQLVDCDDIDQGCNGGLMENTFTWLKNYGIMSDKDYPYKGYDGTCRQDPSKFKMKISGYTLLDTRDEDKIRDFLYETGPLAIGINANTMQFYFGGIIEADDWMCDPDGMNHGITLVGYGISTGGEKYWIGKNSWGSSWGEDGYFRIARGKGACGVNTYISTAVL